MTSGTAATGSAQETARCQACLRGGYSAAVIAERLEITATTVRRHVSGLVHELGLEDRSALTTRRRTRPPAAGSFERDPAPQARNEAVTK